MDSQSVKTTEESGLIKGYDGGKLVKGRKRHLLVDTLGLLLSTSVTPANTSDQEGARRLLAGLKPLVPRLELIWADSAYRGEARATWCDIMGGWRLEIIPRHPQVEGFIVPAVVLDCGTDPGMDRSAAPLKQGLRAQGADERNAAEARDDPADGEALGEERSMIFKTRSKFSMPVFNDQEPILRADVLGPIVIRMGEDSAPAWVNLVATKGSYHPSKVRVAPGQSFEELGISADIEQVLKE
jgi:transposase